MTAIKLTGRVVDWDHEEYDEVAIKPEEAGDFEANGYFVVTVGSSILAIRAAKPNDGDIKIQPKSDMHGRFASAGGHTNYGFSGYFKGFVYLAGKRKALVDWWTLFPGKEHHYAAQQDRGKAEAAIREIIETRAGNEVAKVKGGYAFDAEQGDGQASG
ncbi:hypothetical protein NKH60_19150 [Mesorhizobium sp. M1006]|uniref:hypothetical protein n=1 Tax=Mesorhizobium sp. M1006 TaxID=2957048 RepID=UPI0033385915